MSGQILNEKSHISIIGNLTCLIPVHAGLDFQFCLCLHNYIPYIQLYTNYIPSVLNENLQNV
jgi:hypothetical protein